MVAGGRRVGARSSPLMVRANSLCHSGGIPPRPFECSGEYSTTPPFTDSLLFFMSCCCRNHFGGAPVSSGGTARPTCFGDGICGRSPEYSQGSGFRYGASKCRTAAIVRCCQTAAAAATVISGAAPADLARMTTGFRYGASKCRTDAIVLCCPTGGRGHGHLRRFRQSCREDAEGKPRGGAGAETCRPATILMHGLD